MSKEMLFLCDVLTDWCKKNKMPHRCASDLLYSDDTKGRLTAVSYTHLTLPTTPYV